MTQTVPAIVAPKPVVRLLVLAGMLSTTLCGIAPALAQTAKPDAQMTAANPNDPDIRAAVEQGSTFNKRIQIGVGKSIIVELPQDAAEIFVGNPSVVNAVVRSARKIYLVAAANGQTSVFAMNKAGKQIAVIQVTVGRDIDELRSLLKAAMPKSEIDVKTVADTIILSGTVDSALEAQKAEDIANAFVGYSVAGGVSNTSSGTGSSVNFGSATVIQGKLINSIVVRGRDQVMLKVTIAEVKRNIVKQLGISPTGTWGTAGSNFGAAMVQDNPLGLSAQSTNLSNTGIASIGSQGSIGANIKAFERNGVAHVLAEPTVIAISGESAKFTAGGTIPVAQTATCTEASALNPFASTSTTIQYIDLPYGVTLNFTPVVLSEGRIELHVATEVTEVEGLVSANYGCANRPSTRTRRNETTVELPSGGSIVSAGLIQQKSAQVIQGQPGLLDLPILGALFRSRDFQKEETELMIMVTPYISRSLRPDQIARPDDGFSEASDMQGVFLGRVNRIYSTSQNPQLIKNFKGRVGFITD